MSGDLPINQGFQDIPGYQAVPRQHAYMPEYVQIHSLPQSNTQPK